MALRTFRPAPTAQTGTGRLVAMMRMLHRDMLPEGLQVHEAAVDGSGGQAGLNNLDAQLIVEVAKPQQLGPHALVAGQRVNAHVGATWCGTAHGTQGPSSRRPCVEEKESLSSLLAHLRHAGRQFR